MSARGSVTVEELRQVANEEERAATARLRATYLQYDGRLKRWTLANLVWTLAIFGVMLWEALR